jgi:hypothetical protein
MKGLDLNERYYREAVPPVRIPISRTSRSAALIGWSSEVLGFDDATSTDHNWGPGFWLFLSDEDNQALEASASLDDSKPIRYLKKLYYTFGTQKLIRREI